MAGRRLSFPLQSRLLDVSQGAADGPHLYPGDAALMEQPGELTCGGETVVVKKGDSFFLPAGSGSYAVRGTCQTLVTRV